MSTVTHVAMDKDIPPFLILRLADHPHNSTQAQRMGTVLKYAGVPVTVFGVFGAKALFTFVDEKGRGKEGGRNARIEGRSP